MQRISEMIEYRLSELARREQDMSDDFSEVVHGLADLKVTTRVNGIYGYYLDQLAEMLEMSRSKLAATLLEEAIREAAISAKLPELDWEQVNAWGEKNDLIRDARKQAGD